MRNVQGMKALRRDAQGDRFRAGIALMALLLAWHLGVKAVRREEDTAH